MQKLSVAEMSAIKAGSATCNSSSAHTTGKTWDSDSGDTDRGD